MPISAAAAATAATHRSAPPVLGESRSKITGSGVSISGGGSTFNWPSANARYGSLRPMSTLVLMYSRP